MAQGWDSYFLNLPPLSSDPSTLRRTSESEGSLSKDIENFIGHHDFPGTVASNEAPATKSNLDTNYYSNSSIENPHSDCLYQRFCKETAWQADVEQIEKDYLPRCVNSDISDFATEGLSTSGSFPSSFATDLHDLKEDCGMLATSFTEDYSDVSSCSDTSETRPSCKFMANNSIPKSNEKMNVTTKPSSTEWLCTDTGKMMLPTENLCPTMSKSNVILASRSNVIAEENIVECVQDKLESPEKTVKSSNMVTTVGSVTVEGRSYCGRSPDPKLKEDVERAPTQEKNAKNPMSGLENLTGDGIEYPHGHKEDQVIATSPNIMTTLDNEQDHLDEKVLKKVIEESFHENDNPNFTDGQDENMETNCQKKESQSNTSQSSEQPGIRVPNGKDATQNVAQDNICWSPVVMSDGNLGNASDKNEQSGASHSESYLQPKSLSTDLNPCLEKECTSAAEKTNTIDPKQDCPGPCVISDSLPIDTSDKTEQGLTSHVESCLQPNSASRDLNPCLEKEWTSPPEKETTTSSIQLDCNDPVVASDNKEQSVSNGLESCSQSNSLNSDINPNLKKECPAEKTNATSSPEQQSLHQSLVSLEPGSQNGGVAESKTESFEEMDTSAEEQSALGMLYGEPLSTEDSSCDADGTKFDTSHYKDTSVARPDSNSMNNSQGQAPQLKSSVQMRKLLQPVIILKTSESLNGTSNSYHCADCPHTTNNVDHLIEHHHCYHSVHNFQFCKTCNLYVMKNKQTEKHVCCVTKDGSRLSSDSSLLKKRKRHGGHRCIRCRLIFSKVTQYVSHMRTHTGETPYKCNGCGLYFSHTSSLQRHARIPGRCKQPKPSVTNADAIIKETKTPPQKDLVQNKPYTNLPGCYVKLVDISKTHLCSFCGKCFSTAVKAKKHFYNTHKGKSLAISLSQYTTKHSEKTPKVENDTKGKYKCPLCPRLFKYSYNRARHLRDCVRLSISGGKDKISGKYQCPLCHVAFTLPGNRYRHIKAFCLKECLNRLANKMHKSKEQTNQKKTKETEQKTHSKTNVQKKQPKEIEQKKQAPPASTSLKLVPRYKCNFCPAVFWHGSGKYRHMKKHEIFKLTGKMFRYRNSVFSTLSKPATLNSTNTKESMDTSKSTEENGRLGLSCKFCGSCFKTPQSLKRHERNHRGERPYRCLECGKGYKKRSYLKVHKKSIHQRRIQCTVCRKILPTIGELIQHRSSHLKKGKLQCPDCQLQFQYPAHLLRHLDRHKNRENKTSLLEDRPALKPQQSLDSVKEKSGPKHLQCSICKDVFNDAHVLRKHSLTHISGTSSNQCPFCKRNFNNRRNLLRHMTRHTGDKPFSCTDCGKQFYLDLYLKLHREKCSPDQTRPLVTLESDTKKKGLHQCSYCPRMFSKQIRLKNHHHAHKTNTLLLCSRCGQYFVFRKLNQHRRVCMETTELNTGLSSKDDVCKSTSQASQNVHKMPSKSNATNMLYFKCPHCTQRFRYRSLLLRHLVSHTGVQPYACMHCGHRYGSQSMCLQHEAFCDGVYKEGKSRVKGAAATQLSKTPTLREAAQKPKAEGEAEYKCKFCTKTFMKSRSLRRHILTHNEVKPYRCKACDSCYSRYDHLKVHETRCRGKKTRLEVCIPKISLDYVGKGWQNKCGMEPIEKQQTFECDVCSRSFHSQSKLSRHVTMFHSQKLFTCTRCGSSFSHEKSLKNHRKKRKCRKLYNETSETNPPTKNVTNPLKGGRSKITQRIQPYFNKNYKYACSYCPRAFQNGYQLGVHNRLHTGERPYACEDCGERFIRKDYVQRHYAKCSKKSGISTSILSKSTVCQSKLSTSKSPTKGFSCAYCSSRFLLFSQLQEHFLNAHKLETKVPPVSTAPLQHHLSNIPNIKEEPLDESFDKQLSDGSNVICDLDTAIDSDVPKPFSCPECNMSFTNKAGVAGHLRVHTRKFPFNCKTCKKGFWNKGLLRNHNRKCRFGHTSERSKTQQVEVPLKAEIDIVLNDLVFKETSKSTGSGVLQTNFSCKEEPMDESPQSSEENEVQTSSSKEKKAVQYQCSECDQSFTDGLLLISHLEDHGRQEQAKKRNACIKCGQVFASQGNLGRHMKIHGSDKTISCPDCSKMFCTLSELEIHRTCHDPNRPFICKLCNHRFWTRPSLYNHYREEHPDDVFTCRFCNHAFSVKKSLARHYRRWHLKEQRDLRRTVQEKSCAEQPSNSQVSTTGESDEDENNGSEDSDSDSAPYFPCHVCGKTFPTSESLEDHQRCHLGEKPHECAECGRCFFQASQLQQHQRMHKSEFQCQACGRGFVSLFALRKHKHTHGKSRPYRCSKCDFSFPGPLQLAEHMSIHREENFPCDICNLVFLSKSSRVEHRKSHSKSGDRRPPSISMEECETSASLPEISSVSPKELKYRCGVCSERFGDPEKLSEHGCMAANERPYSCSDCDKYFLHASHLKKHRAVHQLSWSNSEYPCNQCNNSFSSSQHFLSHLKNHDTAAGIKHNTEVKDGGLSHGFICPVCNQCFASATDLICHFPTHPDGPFECKISLPSGSKLEEHERLHVSYSATAFECTECGQSYLGKDAFCQHHCSHQQPTTMEAKCSNPSSKTTPPTYPQAAGEEEEVDVTGEDLYNCPVCSMQFSSKSGLLEHQNKQHRTDKPFICELCGKTFAKSRYLREHERRHRQKIISLPATNKFECSQCNTEFNTSQDLSLHMRLHAEKEVGEYRCDMCYKSFSKWSHLKQHQESHIGQVVYECTECDKAFAFPHLLEEHQQTHVGTSQ